MSGIFIRADGKPSVYSPNQQQAIHSARSATYQLLAQFESFLEELIEHQVQHDHLKKKYQTSPHDRVLNGVRYDGVHQLYSHKEEKAKPIEALSEVLRSLEELYDGIPDDYAGLWQTTTQKLEALILDKAVYKLVEEFLNTLPPEKKFRLIEKASKHLECCRQALDHLHQLQTGPTSKTENAFTPLKKLASYTGMAKLYKSAVHLYTDAEKREEIAQLIYEVLCRVANAGMMREGEKKEKSTTSLKSATQALVDMVEVIPMRCAEAWQAILKQWDKLALDENIDILAKEYLSAVSVKTYSSLKQKIQTHLEACRQAREDIQAAYRARPNPILELFTKLFTLGQRFFERLLMLLPSFIKQYSHLHFD